MSGEKTYKIVNRTFGSLPYWFDSEEEAKEALAQIIKLQQDKPTQYYIREI